jgi:peptide methionine sulfoxide reductase msrA/msrB
MKSIRVTHHRKSHLSLWLGLLAAIVVLAGFLFFSQTQAEKKKSGTFNYLKPVPSDSELRARLNEDQYRVTRQNATETAFRNEFWDNNRAGIYVDVITGEALFTSLDKFDSGTGRPTFIKPISKDRLIEKSDSSFGMQRTEVRARRSDSHLGHVFNDETTPSGQRYAVNSAALRFIPLEKMEAEGYTEFLLLFPKPEGADQKGPGQ